MLAPLLGGEEGKKKRERERQNICLFPTTLFALFYLRSCPFLTPRRYVKHEAFSFVWIHCLSFFFFPYFLLKHTYTHKHTRARVDIQERKSQVVSCELRFDFEVFIGLQKKKKNQKNQKKRLMPEPRNTLKSCNPEHHARVIYYLKRNVEPKPGQETQT